jgi:hypothetical protein
LYKRDATVNDSTKHILASVQDFTQLDGWAVFLRPLISSHVFGVMQFCDGSDKGTVSVNTFCANF